MKALVRYWIAIWFLSRIVFYYIADFSKPQPPVFWDEIYYFCFWGGMLYGNYLIRYLLKLTNLSTETVTKLRSELHKSGLLFVSLILWELLNCINYRAAQSGLTIFLMFVFAALLVCWMILSKK